MSVFLSYLEPSAIRPSACLSHRILERFGGAEFWNFHGRDLHHFTGARVSRLTSSALFDREDAEARDGNLLSFLQTPND